MTSLICRFLRSVYDICTHSKASQLYKDIIVWLEEVLKAQVKAVQLSPSDAIADAGGIVAENMTNLMKLYIGFWLRYSQMTRRLAQVTVYLVSISLHVQ